MLKKELAKSESECGTLKGSVERMSNTVLDTHNQVQGHSICLSFVSVRLAFPNSLS